jgi:gliding motility-associated lipoprotein GldH
MKIRNFLAIVILFTISISCGRGKIFEEHRKIPNMTWDRFQTIKFDVPVEKTGVPYDLVLALRHHTDIPYDEVEINFTMSTPGGETRSRDYIIKIRDREGNLLGDGLGELWDLEVPLKEGYVFSEPGICHIEIANRMTRLKTVGVMEIGFIVRESKEN